MRTAQISVSKRDYLKYGFNSRVLNFSKLKENILKEIFQESIQESIKLAKKIGLSEMTTGEINAEIAKVRGNA